MSLIVLFHTRTNPNRFARSPADGMSAIPQSPHGRFWFHARENIANVGRLGGHGRQEKTKKMSVPKREPEGAFTPAELSIMAKAIDAAEESLDLSEDSAPELTRLRIAAIVLETFQAGERNWQILAEGALTAVKPVLRGHTSTFPPGGNVACSK